MASLLIPEAFTWSHDIHDRIVAGWMIMMLLSVAVVEVAILYLFAARGDRI